jgi:S1-C subfamily serine protease
MISWPPLRPRTAVGGAISSPSRSFLEIEENNPAEYTMNFIQADIASEKGSSGAPLLDGNGRAIGLLHGG